MSNKTEITIDIDNPDELDTELTIAEIQKKLEDYWAPYIQDELAKPNPLLADLIKRQKTSKIWRAKVKYWEIVRYLKTLRDAILGRIDSYE